MKIIVKLTSPTKTNKKHTNITFKTFIPFSFDGFSLEVPQNEEQRPWLSRAPLV